MTTDERDEHWAGTDASPSSKPFVTHRDDSDTPLPVTVVRSVAAVAGEDPADLEPLGETVDTDALDRVIDSLPGGGPGRVTFTFACHRVDIAADGRVEIYPLE